MTDPASLPGPDPLPNSLRGVTPEGGARPAQDAQRAEERGAAFRALLENLEQRAGELEERSRAELAPEELPAAVEDARASMQDALALQEELLEAWRQSRHQRAGDAADAAGQDGPA